VHAVLWWDGAGYHTSADLKTPRNVSVIQLWPDSPELNPVENLWHDLRSHSWSWRVYRDSEEWEESAVGAWREVCLEPELVGSIGNAPYVNDHASNSGGVWE
jgi:DDE superfamily endonuclease